MKNYRFSVSYTVFGQNTQYTDDDTPVGGPVESRINEKTPEMNELETDKNAVKIWAS